MYIYKYIHTYIYIMFIIEGTIIELTLRLVTVMCQAPEMLDFTVHEMQL